MKFTVSSCGVYVRYFSRSGNVSRVRVVVFFPMYSPNVGKLMSNGNDEANMMGLARIWTTNLMSTIHNPRLEVAVVKDQKRRGVLEGSKR